MKDDCPVGEARGSLLHLKMTLNFGHLEYGTGQAVDDIVTRAVGYHNFDGGSPVNWLTRLPRG